MLRPRAPRQPALAPFCQGAAVALEHGSPSALAHFDPADLLDALATGILMLDAQLCPVYANVAAQDLLAFSLKMARGRPFTELLHEPEGLGAILRRQRAARALAAEAALTGDLLDE